MKINDVASTVEIEGDFKTTKFTIEASNSAFDILSSALYSDKETAVIRELACNAYDSHVMANKMDVPIHIHVPTYLEPYFYVEDFGVGLSEDQVMKLYTTYFSSTKSHTNDLIGGLGLGSKSPFCKAESFLVVSTYNGIRTTYTAYKDESGIPSISKLVDEKTTNENGVKVQLDVPSQEFGIWSSKISEFFATFNPKPNFIGQNLRINDDPAKDVVLKGNQWVLHSVRSSHSSKHTAVMGNVRYNINLEKINKTIPDIVQKFSSVYSIRFNLDIGELDISASREEVAYKKKTNEKIYSILLDMQETLEERLQNILKQATTHWEVWKLVNRATSYYSKNIDDVILNFAKSKGTLNVVLNGNSIPLTIPTFSVTDFGLDTNISSGIVVRQGTSSYSRFIRRNNDRMTPSVNNTPIVVIDTSQHKLSNISDYINDSNQSDYVLIVRLPAKCKGTERSDTVKTIMDFLAKRYPGMPLLKYSDIPSNTSVKAAVPITTSNETIGNVLELGENPYYNLSDSWNVTDLTWKNSGTYVKIFNNQIVLDENEKGKILADPRNMIHLVNNMKKLGILDSSFKLYGVRSGIWKSVSKSNKWIDGIAYLKSILTSNIENIRSNLKSDDPISFNSDSSLQRKMRFFDLDGKFKDIDYSKLDPNSRYVRIRNMALDIRKDVNTQTSTKWKELVQSIETLNMMDRKIEAIKDVRYHKIKEEIAKFVGTSYLISNMMESWSSPNSETVKDIIWLSYHKEQINSSTNVMNIAITSPVV